MVDTKVDFTDEQIAWLLKNLFVTSIQLWTVCLSSLLTDTAFNDPDTMDKILLSVNTINLDNQAQALLKLSNINTYLTNIYLPLISEQIETANKQAEELWINCGLESLNKSMWPQLNSYSTVLLALWDIIDKTYQARQIVLNTDDMGYAFFMIFVGLQESLVVKKLEELLEL